MPSLLRGALLSALVVALGAIGAEPIVSAGSHAPVTDATLVLPFWYVALTPICRTLDALTVLSVKQHVAVLITLALMMIAWRVAVHRRQRTEWWREVRLGALGLAAWIVVYAGGALIPRPMAALKMHDPDDVVIDFHSHTNASWDGRRTFTAERNRGWHTESGFHVAYVSDHNTLVGALQGMAKNPPVANGQTILLPAVERRDHYEHIIAIGIDTAAPQDPKGDWHDPLGDTTIAHRRTAPMLILTIPGNINTLPPNEIYGVSRVMAVEAMDGSPRGIGQNEHDAGKIIALANRMQLSLVSGSDNHGWGSTAGSWSVMHIPGWRLLHPSQLDSAIQQTVRDQRNAAARVYMRNTPNPGASTTALAVTLPLMLWRIVADLSWPERGVWVVWILIVALLTDGYYSIWGKRNRDMTTDTPGIVMRDTITPDTRTV